MARDNVMTEQEAIEVLKNNYPKMCKMVNGRYRGGFDNTESDFGQALTMAISVLKEIQQYREIGTVEECRVAVEKQKPKAPKDSLKIKPVIGENGAYVDADVTVYLLCPNCEEMVGIDENVDKFCHECGQAIDNENLEGME